MSGDGEGMTEAVYDMVEYCSSYGFAKISSAFPIFSLFPCLPTSLSLLPSLSYFSQLRILQDEEDDDTVPPDTERESSALPHDASNGLSSKGRTIIRYT